jgi:hypothetical protein
VFVGALHDSPLHGIASRTASNAALERTFAVAPARLARSVEIA